MERGMAGPDDIPDDELDLDSGAAAPKPKRGLIKVLAMVGGGLVVVAASVGATLFFLGGGGGSASDDSFDIGSAVVNPTADNVGGQADAKGGDKPAKQASAKSSGKTPEKPAIYLPLEPPFTVNFESAGSVHFLQISMEIMARDQAVIDAVTTHRPLIQNNLLLLLSNLSYQDISTREARETLRQKALDVIRESLARETKAAQVEDVYFTSFVMQ
jgi:flagellar FliL protein